MMTQKRKSPQKNPDKRRVAVYGRIADGQGGLEISSEYYSTLIQSTPEWSMAGIFLETCPASLPADRRPAFRNLLRKCRAKQVDLVLVRSISCLARNTAECLRYVRKLREEGIEIRFEKENLGTEDPALDIAMELLKLLAESEARYLSGKSFGWPAGRRSIHRGREYP